jgi:hypothetical protein
VVGLGVTPGGDQNVQNTPVLVNRAPQVVALPLDRDEHLVEMPTGPLHPELRHGDPAAYAS